MTRRSRRAPQSELAIGDRFRTRGLGTEAEYQIVHLIDAEIRLKVISAPGLQPGFEFRVKADSLRAIEKLEVADVPMQVPVIETLVDVPTIVTV